MPRVAVFLEDQRRPGVDKHPGGTPSQSSQQRKGEKDDGKFEGEEDDLPVHGRPMGQPLGVERVGIVGGSRGQALSSEPVAQGKGVLGRGEVECGDRFVVDP